MKEIAWVTMTVLLSFVLLTPLTSYSATSEGGHRKISGLRFSSNGLLVRFDPAPESCGGGTQFRMHAIVYSAHQAYQEMVAGLIAAYMGNKSIKFIWVDNVAPCSTTSILSLVMFELGEY